MHARLHVFARDVLEETRKVDLLLIAPAECMTRRLTYERDDRLMIELGVVEHR
jgi:hypothetical protein